MSVTKNIHDLESELLQYRNRLHQITSNMLELYCETTVDGVIQYSGPSHLNILGFDPDQIIGKNVFTNVHPDDLEKVMDCVKESLQSPLGFRYEYRFKHADGHYIWLESVCCAKVEQGRISGIVISSRDITARKKMEQALRTSEERLKRITDNMMDMILELDPPDWSAKYLSPSHKVVLGYELEEMMGHSVSKYVHPDDLPKIIESFNKQITSSSSAVIEYRCRHKNGTYLWLEACGTVLYDENKEISTIVISSRNISQRKRAEERLKFLSLHDSVTGLYNRSYFEEEMMRFDYGPYIAIGLIMIDLDGLKLVNDTFGHATGDQMLIAVADILKKSLRKGDVVARIGGDEFAILLPGALGIDLEKVANRIQTNIDLFNEQHEEMHISISLGAAIRDSLSKTMTDTYIEADNNMYRVKLHHQKSARSSIVQALVKALEVRDFITEGHGDRMQDMASGVGELLGLPRSRIYDLRLFAQFHDIGKVGIPDHILFKNGKLTELEYQVIKGHCEIGYRIAQSSPELMPIADWILKHHEWWNGQGYPLGLQGEEIPLECRILSITDAYDAMTSDRPYRKALSHEQAVEELYRFTGSQFDPYLLPKVIEVIESIKSNQ